VTTVEPGCLPGGDGLPATAAAARGRVRALLAARLGAAPSSDARVPLEPPAVVDVLLVTSELVTNAIRHAGGLTGFAASVEGDLVSLDVSDASCSLPATDDASLDLFRPGGFGWPLVCKVAEDVRITRQPGGGKTIHVRVRLP
jgi:anti-sigma regulatory factor (Ser/Thr protein kinase)